MNGISLCHLLTCVFSPNGVFFNYLSVCCLTSGVVWLFALFLKFLFRFTFYCWFFISFWLACDDDGNHDKANRLAGRLDGTGQHWTIEWLWSLVVCSVVVFEEVHENSNWQHTYDRRTDRQTLSATAANCEYWLRFAACCRTVCPSACLSACHWVWQLRKWTHHH